MLSFLWGEFPMVSYHQSWMSLSAKANIQINCETLMLLLYELWIILAACNVLRPQQQKGKTIRSKRIKLDGLTSKWFPSFELFSFSTVFAEALLTYHLVIYFWLRNLLGHESSNIRFFPWNTGNFPKSFKLRLAELPNGTKKKPL